MTLMLLTVTATMPFLPAEPRKPWIACSVMELIYTISTDMGKMRSFIKNPEILKKLIELGLDTSHTDTNGYTCIFEHYRNAEGLTELINAGCDINHIDKKE